MCTNCLTVGESVVLNASAAAAVVSGGVVWVRQRIDPAWARERRARRHAEAAAFVRTLGLDPDETVGARPRPDDDVVGAARERRRELSMV